MKKQADMQDRNAEGNPGAPEGDTADAMNTKLLMIIAFAFFLSWRKAADDFLLFCALFAAGLWVCVLIYRTDPSGTLTDDE